MKTEALPAIGDLVRVLHDPDVNVREAAAYALGEIGPAAEEAISALFAAADDEDEGVAEMAVWALEEIDLTDEEAEDLSVFWKNYVEYTKIYKTDAL